MSLPDEIVIDQDNPNAGDFIYVSGRCYEKTTTSGEEYTVTHDQVFGGMLDTKQVTVQSPKNSPKDTSETRTDVMLSKFTDCNDCGSYGERYRGQKKETGKDFKIKVIYEIDTDAGQAFKYKLNGEDRNGFFNLSVTPDNTRYRDLVFFDNDSVVFDIKSLNENKASFKIDGLGATTSADGNKLTIGTPRGDSGLYSNPRNTASTLQIGTYTYAENSDDSVGGKITILASPYENNSQYDEEKLKQFPERLVAGLSHSLLIKNDGRVYGVGDNKNFNLAIDRSRPNSSRRQTIDYWESTLINEVGPIKKISGCGDHHCYITYDNKLYLAGRNDRGQLGRGTTADSAVPAMPMIKNQENEPINLSEDIHTRIVDADAGYYHTVALDVNQRIWVWGTSGMHGSMMLSFNNSAGGNNGVDNNSPSPYDSHDASGQRWSGYTAGGHARYYTKALLAYWGDDRVVGSNPAYIKSEDQFENKDDDVNIVQVACGLYQTFILNSEGKVFSCGWNGKGQLGQGHLDKETDVTYSQQPHKSLRPVSKTGLGDAGFDVEVKKIIPGHNHTLLLTTNDELWGFGYNVDGCLGSDPSDNEYYTVPIKISADGEQVYAAFAGQNSSAYISYTGKVFVAGRNTNGKLGIDRFIEAPVPAVRSTTNLITTFTESPALTGAIEIKMGDEYTLALMTDGQVVALGDNLEAAMGTRGPISTTDSDDSYNRYTDQDSGQNSNNLLNFGRDIDFKDTNNTIFCAANTTYIWEKEDEDQRLKAAGRSNVYQGGFYNTVATAVPAEKDLVAIDQTIAGTITKNGAKIKSMVVKNSDTVKIINDKGELWSFGNGDRYQHGNNSTSNIATPVQPIANDAPLENIEVVGGGYYHTLALDNKNRLWGYGTGGTAGALARTYNNSAGGNNGWRYQESPYNSYDSSTQRWSGYSNGGHAYTQNTARLLNDGGSRVIPDYVGRIVDIQCTAYSTFILNEDGELFSFGYNQFGELGQRRTTHWNDTSIAAGHLHNSFGRVYPYTSVLDARVKKVIPGGRHCLAIMEDNSLIGWGRNDVYQLGLDAGNSPGRVFSNTHNTPILLATDVEDAFAGLYNSAYKKLDGSVYAMGYNKDGQLAGFGDGRTLGLDKYDDMFGLKTETDFAKMPIPWFEPSDRVLEVAFGGHHSLVKRVKLDSQSRTRIEYYSAGSNEYGQRGIGRDPDGKNGSFTSSADHQEFDTQGGETYAGSDKWSLVSSLLLQ